MPSRRSSTSLRPGAPRACSPGSRCARTRWCCSGSARADERRFFDHLVTVTGVGPKLALAVLSVLTPDALRRAIATGDAARSTKVPGVGKKVAGAHHPGPEGQAGRRRRARRSTGPSPRSARRCWRSASRRQEARDALAALRAGRRPPGRGAPPPGAPERGTVSAREPSDAGATEDLSRRAPTGPRGPEAGRSTPRSGRGGSRSSSARTEHQGAARPADRGRPRPRRAGRPRPALGPAGPRQDHARRHRRERDRRRVPARPAGPALERAGDLAAILTNLEEGDVLFVDEVHRMPRTVEEVLYPALEDFKLDVVIGKGPSRAEHPPRPAAVHAGGGHDPPRADHAAAARALRLLAAARLLLAPRISPASWRAPPASWTCESTPPAPSEIAGRSRGTPRIANRLLRRVRDSPQVRGDGRVTLACARRRPGAVRGRRARAWTSWTSAILTMIVEKFRRRAGRPVDARGGGGGGARHDRGRVRALPDAARVPEADAAGPGRHAGRRTSTSGSPAGRRPGALLTGRPLRSPVTCA